MMPDLPGHAHSPYEHFVETVAHIDAELGNRVADAVGTEVGHTEVISERDALQIELRSRRAITVEEVLAYELTLFETGHLAGIRMYAEFGQAEAEAGGLPHVCPKDLEDKFKELDLWPEGV